MAPTRKSRSVNKRYSDYVDVSPSKNVASKSGRQKRKLSDMLGSPWTDEEVERFYKAYRKFGKDWKKVATMVRTRTSEMVEALYTMNRAYLSLPEGTASVVGFIAMVSDHYNAMDGSDNDQETNDFQEARKPKKRNHGLVQKNGKEEHKLLSRQVGSSDGRSPQLKIRESDGCTVRKRTPRFPINHSSRRDNVGNYASPSNRSQKREVDDVAHGAALALTEALQRGGSPQASQSPYHMKPTPSKGRQKIWDTMRTKNYGNLMDEDAFEGSSGSRGAENVNGEEVYHKGKKLYGQKDDNEFDGGEACSGTGEGLADIEVADENIEQCSSQGKRKRNKKLFFKDESSGLDALETLANLSLMMQSSKVDSDTIVLKDDKPPTGHRRYKTKVSADKEKIVNEFPRVDAFKSGRSKPGRESKVDYKALSEGKHLDHSFSKPWKKRNKSSSIEAPFKDEEKFANKVTSAKEDNAPSKNCKATRLVEYSSSNSNTSRTGPDSAISKSLLANSDDIDLPSKRRNKRKVIPNKLAEHDEMKLGKIASKSQPIRKTEHQEGPHYLKERAFRHLSSSSVRRWSTYEWFYSAIDYPWFVKREFVEYLHHVGLGHIPRLTKVEWGVIRSSLGKPRRFSSNFLREEKEKLWQYRESVRKHYTELRSGTREGLPTDLARPLAVGQRVVAIHPESREVHDGSVLTVDHDKCRIQFDRPELGVAFVKDIDCMPSNLLENMPEALRRESSELYRFSLNSREPPLSQSVVGSFLKHGSNDHLEQIPTITLNHQPIHNGSAPVKAAENVSQIQSRETDIRALSELTRTLDKKEAILAELKLVNDGLISHKNETGVDMKLSESFKKEYALVLMQLKEASDQVTSALLNLRQRNTYPGNPLPPWQKLQSSSSGFVGPISSADNSSSNNQLPSNVVETVNNSRLEVHKLVHTATQALSKINGEQNVHSQVAAVMDSLKFPIEYGSSTIRPSEQANGGTYKNKLNSTPDPFTNYLPSDSKLQLDDSVKTDSITFELIVSCVASFRLMQVCTEQQYPPSDVVQMLDSAFARLHPLLPQHLPIFKELQMCMGRLKTQILARVPS
ncbi:protein ALWAYS EARLY 3-like isoform X2 [Rutidosis leptorrhynchoides]|uniref:protein ALWAYS EARLY 3-like isoform X2 n=1 Tax=Rutidosis leptorrhynchoides TaxID=125765 RepID=UPI003A99451E